MTTRNHHSPSIRKQRTMIEDLKSSNLASSYSKRFDARTLIDLELLRWSGGLRFPVRKVEYNLRNFILGNELPE